MNPSRMSFPLRLPPSAIGSTAWSDGFRIERLDFFALGDAAVETGEEGQ